MAQIVVLNLNDAVVERLKAQAREKGQSLEQTVREILRDAARPSRRELVAFAAEIRRRTAARRPTIDVVAAIRHDRDTDHARHAGPANNGKRHGTDHRPQP